MTDTRRGADDTPMTPHQPEVPTAEAPRRATAGYGIKQGTKAPGAKHFERLEACMQEALDEGDDFSRRQAASILAGMAELLGVDIKL